MDHGWGILFTILLIAGMVFIAFKPTKRPVARRSDEELRRDFDSCKKRIAALQASNPGGRLPEQLIDESSAIAADMFRRGLMKL